MSTPLAVSEVAKESGRQLEKVRYTHDAMIDLILMNPKISQNEIALHFGYSVGWTSTIFNSDSFQKRLAERKTEVVDPVVTRTVEEGMVALAQQSLQIVQKKLQATENPDLAIKALDLSAKALGMGARDRGPAVNNTFVVALPPKAADEHDWAKQAKAGNVVDVVAKS